MPLVASKSRPFAPGTTGWTASDLDDPAIERQWEAGRFEIIDGVLTTMSPAYYIGGKSLYRLMSLVTAQIDKAAGSFAMELEIVIDQDRVVRADAAFLTPEQEKLQEAAALAAGRSDPDRTRILIPPKLIIECLSPGHERHDTHTKRRWYAELGVEHYWLLDPFKKTLECLILSNGKYVKDAEGEGNAEVRPSTFAGLVLQLKEVWG